MNKKRKIVGPKISYLSTAMPLMTEESTIVGQEKYERTFIILSEDCANVDDILPSTATQPKVKPMKSYCPVTGLPAKYFDPVTNTPYATLEAFKTIREAYYQHVEELGNRKDPAVAAWLAQRRAQMVWAVNIRDLQSG